MSSRCIVIGDPHGCADEVQDLLRKVGFKMSDRLISVGDNVDRGPKPGECVRIFRYDGESCMGNHESWHLNARKKLMLASMNGMGAPYVPPHKTNVWEQLNDKDWLWMESLPYYIDLPEYGAAVVHAGVFPGIPLQCQTENHLMRIQCIKPPSRSSYWPSEVPDEEYKFWTNHYEGPERIIFGHTHLTKPLVSKHAVGIDCGVVHGNFLTAVILPSWEIVQVPARKNYHSSTGTRQTYPVMDGVEAY